MFLSEGAPKDLRTPEAHHAMSALQRSLLDADASAALFMNART